MSQAVIPPGQQITLRLPLAVTPDNRDNTVGKDARLINAFVEQTPDGQSVIFKRPGYSASVIAAAQVGRGLYNWLGNIYSIFGTQMYKDGVSLGTSIYSLGGLYTFSQTLGTAPILFFHNTQVAYKYTTAGGVVNLVGTTSTATTGTTAINSPVITTITNLANVLAGSSVVGTGVPLGAYVLTVDSATQVTININATAAATLVALTFGNPGFPANVVPGQAYLNGYTYVMTTVAAIYNSKLNDVSNLAWSPLNYLIAQIEPDGGVYLAKQLVYVIAFKQWSTEVFYDAGNPVGSPLAQVQAAKVNYGCRIAGSVAEVESRLIWISTTRSGNIGVMVMESLKVRSISTPAIERILQEVDYTQSVYSWGANIGGHELYILTCIGANITLVYDFSTKLWSQWTDSSGNYFPFIASTFSAMSQVILQHISNGTLVTISQLVFQDAGGTITVTVVTPEFDAGSRKIKYLSKLDFISDQTTGSTLSVRASDDSYVTWSNTRTVDLSKKKPNLTDCGSFVKRAYEIKYTANTPLRLYGIEMQVELGET